MPVKQIKLWQLEIIIVSFFIFHFSICSCVNISGGSRVNCSERVLNGYISVICCSHYY